MKSAVSLACISLVSFLTPASYANDPCHCQGYAGPGGPCYAGPGGAHITARAGRHTRAPADPATTDLVAPNIRGPVVRNTPDPADR
jgi:hypothetical protein